MLQCEISNLVVYLCLCTLVLCVPCVILCMLACVCIFKYCIHSFHQYTPVLHVSSVCLSLLSLLSVFPVITLWLSPLSNVCRLLATPPPSLTFSPSRMATTSAAISFIVSQIASSDGQACISALRQVGRNAQGYYCKAIANYSCVGTCL